MLIAVLTAALLASLSLVALAWLPSSAGWLTGAGILFSVAAVGALRARPSLWFLATLAAVVSWSALLAPAREHLDVSALHGGLVRFSFEVARGGCGTQGCWCEAELTACSELQAQGCLPPGSVIAVASERELPLGASITALARLKPRVMFFNSGPGTVWPDMRPQVVASLEPGSAPRIDRLSLLDGWVASARQRIRVGLERSLRAPHAGIARALILGEGAAVERELNDAIRNAGVSHVLAVSGMHVTLLVGALVLALRWVWLLTPLALHWEARRVAASVGVLLAPLIARLCGASPSAVRAAWTSTLMYLVVAVGLRPSALAVSALVVCIHATACPRDALHPGFVLSVLATAALLSHTRLAGGSSGTSSLLAALRESLRAWLATTPFLLLCFGQTSLVSLLANVALIPLGSALVPLAAVHALLQSAGASGSLQALLALVPTRPLFELTSAAFLEAARFCAALDPGLSLPPMTGVQVCALTGLCCALMLPLSWRVRVIALLGASALSLASEWALRHELGEGQLRVTFLDVGQGDAALIELGTGEAALIDAGGNVGGGPDPGKLAVLPLLRARRIARLQLVVLSHPHPDHYGGLFALLEALPVRELWDTGQAEAEEEGEDAAVARLLARARALGTRVRRPAELCGSLQALGSARLEVLAPCPAFDLALGANDNSYVLQLRHGRRSFLFTGDVEQTAEAQLIAARLQLHSDVLKVGHHGSRSSSGPALLAAVAPWLAVVSAGRANRFGHPHAEVVARLQSLPHWLSTQESGGIEVQSDGDHLTVRTAMAASVLQR